MRSCHLAGFHRLPARRVLTPVHRGYARTLERSPNLGRTLFRLTQRCQRLFAHAAPPVVIACFTGPVGVVSSDSPRQRVVRMRGSEANIASRRQPRGHGACDKHVSKDSPITRWAVIFQNKFLPLHGLSVGRLLCGCPKASPLIPTPAHTIRSAAIRPTGGELSSMQNLLAYNFRQSPLGRGACAPFVAELECLCLPALWPQCDNLRKAARSRDARDWSPRHPQARILSATISVMPSPASLSRGSSLRHPVSCAHGVYDLKPKAIDRSGESGEKAMRR
jgi:hypothetical protein